MRENCDKIREQNFFSTTTRLPIGRLLLCREINSGTDFETEKLKFLQNVMRRNSRRKPRVKKLTRLA